MSRTSAVKNSKLDAGAKLKRKGFGVMGALQGGWQDGRAGQAGKVSRAKSLLVNTMIKPVSHGRPTTSYVNFVLYEREKMPGTGREEGIATWGPPD